MAVQWTRLRLPPPALLDASNHRSNQAYLLVNTSGGGASAKKKLRVAVAAALDNHNNIDSLAGAGGDDSNANLSSKSGRKGSPSSNYVVPLDKSSCITRPLAEILRDLNKRVPDNIIQWPDHEDSHHTTYIPWHHANRMLSFYAPGWCGEIRDVIFSENSTVTVVYRVTIRGSDGEAHREATGTVSSNNGQVVDPVGAAEKIAFCRACARFGLGLYLYND